MIDQQTADFMQAIARTATSESEARFAALLAATVDRIDQAMAAQTDRLIEALDAPRRLKGPTIVAFRNQAGNALSDYPVDCSRANAVQVQVFTGGATPSATLTIEGADAAGANFRILPDAAATQALTADASFVVVVGTRFVRARLASLTGGTWTVIITPYVA